MKLSMLLLTLPAVRSLEFVSSGVSRRRRCALFFIARTDASGCEACSALDPADPVRGGERDFYHDGAVLANDPQMDAWFDWKGDEPACPS